MNFRGIIFDLDGTLVNSLEDLADSMNAVLADLDLPEHPLADYRLFVGKGMHSLVSNALPAELRNTDFIETCFKRMFEQYSSKWDRKTRLYDGIPELLDELTSKNIRMSIVSNKAQHFTIPVVKKFLGEWSFYAVFGEREGVPRKPDPVSLNEASALMSLPPAEIMCLGDSGTDMTAAINAGMYPAGALWGFRSAEELLAGGAATLLNHPSDLMELFA